MRFLVLVEFEILAGDAKDADNKVISELEGHKLKGIQGFMSVDVMDRDRQ